MLPQSQRRGKAWLRFSHLLCTRQDHAARFKQLFVWTNWLCLEPTVTHMYPTGDFSPGLKGLGCLIQGQSQEGLGELFVMGECQHIRLRYSPQQVRGRKKMRAKQETEQKKKLPGLNKKQATALEEGQQFPEVLTKPAAQVWLSFKYASAHIIIQRHSDHLCSRAGLIIGKNLMLAAWNSASNHSSFFSSPLLL